MKIPDISEIMVAWARAANPTEEQLEKAEQRAKICDGCEFRTWATVMHTWKCSACGCPLNKKIFSPKGPAACPKEKWTI